jgi:hypothetical protein
VTGNRLGPSGSGVVLLTEDGVLPKETKDYLAGIDPAVSKVYAVGGHCVAAVATGEPGWKGKVTNLAGADRYATAAAVAGSAMFPPGERRSAGPGHRHRQKLAGRPDTLYGAGKYDVFDNRHLASILGPF